MKSKVLLIIFTLLFYSLHVFCQKTQKTIKTFTPSEFENAFKSLDELRALLLERGFTLTHKASSETRGNTLSYYPERWVYNDPNTYPETRIMINDKDLGINPLLIIHIFISQDETSISYKISKDYFSQYIDQFLENVKTEFPEKKIQTMTVEQNGKTDEVYILFYSRKGSNIVVKFDNSGQNFTEFNFIRSSL
jgi:hypothetical protein